MRALILCLIVVCPQIAAAQTQPHGVSLNAAGVSRILPPFDSAGWVLTRSSGVVTHLGDDYYAQDWALNCHSTGQRLYAGISGSVHLDPKDNGSMDYYGNAVTITDLSSGFVQRFAHLDSFASGLQSGDLVLAGQFVGRVGATGNVSASAACAAQGGNGAHAHIVLYKGLSSFGGRPLTRPALSGGPTAHAARFVYTAGIALIKGQNDPTVYAYDGVRHPVSAAVFDSQGWNFDRYRMMFNPLAGNTHPDEVINGLPLAQAFWPMRNGTLIRAQNDPTVYLVQDGRRKGLSYDVFLCRGFGFGEVKVLPDAEMLSHAPLGAAPVAVGCADEFAEAMRDFVRIINLDPRLQTVQLGTYAAAFDWDFYWELRSVNFAFEGGRFTTVYHITYRFDPTQRHVLFWDPVNNVWSGWHRIN